ncbi:MAG TPA: nucleotidyltransferase family protein [Nevskiaceae bacterium]
MTTTPRAMILAAGRGERLRPLTDHQPKALTRVAGDTLVERHLRRLARAGVHEIVVNLGWLGAQLRQALGDGGRYGVSIAWSDEGWPALETGGGVQRALPLLGAAPFLLVNADIWTDYPLADLLARARELAPRDLVHLVTVANPAHHPRGDFAVRDGRVTAGGERWTFAGLSVQRPELFAHSRPGAFPIAPLWREAIHAGRAAGERYAGRWFDVGTPERLAEAAAWAAAHPDE